LDSPPLGVTLNGTAGAPFATPVKVHVDSLGFPLAGVSVRLLNSNVDPVTNVINGASASCATGAGADPGSVLTDANGDGICTIVFGPISGAGSFTALVGGVDN